jgi:3-hydroxymyristoyl/3-hydroxydecanoyl-(acyl carrier protein) dehydratase
MFFAGMDKVKFRKPVVPGDQLIVEVKVIKLRSKIVKLSGTAKVDGKLVAEAELLAYKGEAQ